MRLGLLLTAVLALASVGWPNGARSDGTEPTPVTLAEVRREAWRAEVELTGTLTAVRRSALSPEVEGRVVELRVDEGVEVGAGELLLRLDAKLAEIDRDAAEARLAEAEARYRDAVRVRDELLRLKEGRHASETDIQAAIAQVEIAAAAVEAARAEVARAGELLARHQLSAPFAGVIVAKRTEQGEWLQRDQAAFELIAMDRLRVRATLPQRDYARIAAGAPARVRFDAFPGAVFDGEVVAKIAAGDARSRIFPVLIDLPNPGHRLAPGMSARVRVAADSGTEQVVTVPRDAIVAEVGGERRVWRVEQVDGVATAQPLAVELGRAQDGRVEVLGSALGPGDQVVLLGNEQLEPDERVAPQ
ncbi:MAG: efflux RND transporter periplasmic adaptor subunit [Gammaproteobacteria bacterium]|jgi:RND family efflux transporter MFP subunit|nr:efflux RND transporter periplasmic adaptor subunit [Gammaproteobacteria bacterium]